MAGGNSRMADWDANEAPRTRVILVDSHVLAGPRCMRAMTRRRPSNRDHQSFTGRTPQWPWPAVGHLVQSATRRHRHLPARSRNSRQSLKSPHGQPSPALLRSIHRPYPRHNAEETGGGLIAKRPENRRRLRFPSSAATKTPHCRYWCAASCSSHPAGRFCKYLKHTTRGATQVQARNGCMRFL